MILANVHVLRVEREEIRTGSATYGTGTETTTRSTTVYGDVVRLYLELTREQAETMAFALHNGALNLPAKAEPAGDETPAYTWDDFEESIFVDREAWEEANPPEEEN